MATTKKVKVALLVRDTSVYPRIHINDFNIASISRALRAGFSIPSVIADEKTYVLVDGWHRCESAVQVYGPDAEIEVEFRQYKNRAAILADAILLQNHGERLQPIDMARCLILAEQVGMQQERLAECLHVGEDWLAALRRRKVADGPDGPIPIKGTLANFAIRQNDRKADGEENPPALNRKQVEANKRANGLPWWFILDQAINVLSGGLVPLDNEKAIFRLKRLSSLLSTAVEKIDAA